MAAAAGSAVGWAAAKPRTARVRAVPPATDRLNLSLPRGRRRAAAISVLSGRGTAAAPHDAIPRRATSVGEPGRTAVPLPCRIPASAVPPDRPDWLRARRPRPLLSRRAVAGPAVRRLVRHRGDLDRHLLPARAARPGPRSGATSGSCPRPPPPSGPGSEPASGAGRTPRPARRSGTSGPTWSAGPCDSSPTGSSTGEGVPGLAARLGYSVRQLERLLLAEVGAGPVALARAQRAQTARILIETTGLPMTEVAFAAGFSSIRQFNDTVQAVFAVPPSALRARRTGRVPSGGRRPGHARPATPVPSAAPTRTTCSAIWRPRRCPGSRRSSGRHLPPHAPPPPRSRVRGPHAHGRPHRLPGGPGRRGRPDLGHRPVPPAPRPGRRPRGRRPGPGRRPAAGAAGGRRAGTAGAPDGRRRRVRGAGRAGPTGVDGRRPDGGRCAGSRPRRPGGRPGRRARPTSSPRPTAVGRSVAGPAREAGPGRWPTWSTPWRRAGSTSARAPTATLARRELAALPGIGPWTVEMVAMRALGDPDAFPVGDLGVRRAAEGLGLPAGARCLTGTAERWRPWRAYAVQYLWATSDHPINSWPLPTAPSAAAATLVTDPPDPQTHHRRKEAPRPCLTTPHPPRPPGPSSTPSIRARSDR